MEMTQNYRNTDPETSRIAGEAVENNGKRMAKLIMAAGAVRMYPGRTAAELSHLTGLMDRYDFNRRLSDAANEHKVRHGEKRKCTVLGTMCMTWEMV